MSKESNCKRESPRKQPSNYVKRSSDLGNFLRGVPERFVHVEIITYRERPIGDHPLFIEWVCSAGDWRLPSTVASHDAYNAFSKHVHSTHDVLADQYQQLCKAWRVTASRSAIPKGARRVG